MTTQGPNPMAPTAYEMVKVLAQAGYSLDNTEALVKKAYEICNEFYKQTGLLDSDGNLDAPKIMKV